jgi:hypothetical protein
MLMHQKPRKPPTVTKLEVISDAIKIGLPLLGAGLIAVFTFWATRSHEREKERQRRRQDALEKVSDDFQAACFTLSDLAKNYSAYRELHNDPTARSVAIRHLFESGGAMDAATKNLHVIGGRLKLLGLEECEQVFTQFLNETIAFRKMLKLPPEPMATKDMVGQGFDKVQAHQVAVERLLADAFNSL